MSDRKHCVPNRSLYVTFVLRKLLKNLKVPGNTLMHVLGVTGLKGMRRLRVGKEYFLIVRGKNIATHVKERGHVCHRPSIIGKCERIFNNKISCERFESLNRDVYRMFRIRFVRHRDANL